MRFTHVLLCSACLSLVACSTNPRSFTLSDKHIEQSNAAPITAGSIPQTSTRPVVLPPPKPAAKVETYSVVVTSVPAREILFALARDAKINIDIGPGIEGVVTLNAIDQTLPQILDRISKQIDIRYTIENGNLFVEADKPFLKTYKIDFINMSRTVTSKIFTSSQIGGATGSTTGSTTTGGNTASTAVTSETKNNLMDSLIENVRAIIVDEDRIRYTDRIERRNEMAASAQGTGAASVNSGNAPGSGANNNANSEKNPSGKASGGASGIGNEEIAGKTSTVQQTAKYEPAVNINANKETGVLIVRATARQHKKIQEFIDKVMTTARRQVLIEATIAEVTLNDNYQQGINWSALAQGAKGFQLTQAGTSTLPSNNTGSMFVLKYNNATSMLGNLSSSVSLLDSFGDVKVLSSPKLSVMNNQTATLKVVDNRVYFSILVTPGISSVSGNIPPTYTTTPIPVAVGFTMNVTPEINDSDYVTINVRPTITRIIDYVNDPNPSLAYPCGAGVTNCNVPAISNQVPEIRTREMESIIRVSSGQIAVLGGLMQDEINNQSDGIPLLANIPVFGNLFKNRNDTKTKTELVIFLRPIIIKDASINGDYSAYRDNLPDANFLKPEDEKAKP
ncbi:type II secretion system protein D precursor [mine drainage metagenome]|uniref:Type II secretion system protein D n=1 Tax=mine drainage metagenome TaxID=410659 RepID=A0A1J5T8V0_9ZZZZ